jgi:hypothetical protein
MRGVSFVSRIAANPKYRTVGNPRDPRKIDELLGLRERAVGNDRGVRIVWGQWRVSEVNSVRRDPEFPGERERDGALSIIMRER